MPPPSRRHLVVEALTTREGLPYNKKTGVGTVNYLAKVTGLNKTTVKRHIRAMHAAGEVFIADYKRTIRDPAAIFVLGKGQDAPYPAPLPHAAYCRKYRKNVKTAIERARRGFKYDERYAGQVAKALAADVAQRTRENPQHWFSLLEV